MERPLAGYAPTNVKRLSSEWCKEHNVTKAAIREELDKSGYLIYGPDGEVNRSMYIGQGSKIPSGLTRCYELKYHKLMDGVGLSEVSPAETGEAKDAV